MMMKDDLTCIIISFMDFDSRKNALTNEYVQSLEILYEMKNPGCFTHQSNIARAD